MAIEGFDYQGFAQSMAEQARELVPQDLKDFEKNYIVKTLGDFTLKAGEALYNDTSLQLTVEQAVFITQIIAEWSFHKSVDLVHSGILPEYWDNIMQKIAFTIFEISKQAIIRKIPENQLLQAVEAHVVKVYKQCIDELQQKGVIDEEVKERAQSQSNIDAMAQAAHDAQVQQSQQVQTQEQEMTPEEKAESNSRAERRAQRKAQREIDKTFNQGITHKQLKLMSLALVLKVLGQDKVTTILNKFDQSDSAVILKYMDMADLESHLDGDLIADCLNDMKTFLPIKRKLTKENIILDLIQMHKAHGREKIEKILKNERPLVKRFVSQSYDGEYGDLPLRVAGVVTDYINESL